MSDKKGNASGRDLVANREVRGTNQLGMRLSNERLVLALIRRYPGVAKTDIAKLTGLTPQAATIIINRLELDGLLCRHSPVRGKVGQPAIPYRLNPNGAFSIGLSIGRRWCEMILMDFVADIRERIFSEVYQYPLPDPVVDFAVDAYHRILAGLSYEQRSRVCGYGVATPFRLKQ